MAKGSKEWAYRDRNRFREALAAGNADAVMRLIDKYGGVLNASRGDGPNEYAIWNGLFSSMDCELLDALVARVKGLPKAIIFSSPGTTDLGFVTNWRPYIETRSGAFRTFLLHVLGSGYKLPKCARLPLMFEVIAASQDDLEFVKTVMSHGMSVAPESWSEEDRELWERPLDAPGPKPKLDLEQTILDRRLFNVASLCLEHGLDLTFEHCCFNERAGFDTLEFLGGFSHSFERFYGPVQFGGQVHTSFCPAGVLAEAIERGFQTNSLATADACSDAWKALLLHERFDVAEVLLTHGLLDLQSCPPERVTQGMLDWAAKHGLIVQCKAPSLVLASGKSVSWRGAKEEFQSALSSNRPLAPIDLPSFDCACDQRAIGRAESLFLSSYAPPGMWGVCDTLDAELIEAYLAAGYVDDVDPSAAIEAGREDILELYRQYGASCKPKRIIEGSRYIKKWRARQQSGEIRIPRGVEMVSEGAFALPRQIPDAWDVSQGSATPWVREALPLRVCTKIELPETLRYIGSRAFSGVQMESVVIPKSVQNIGVGAFFGAKRITIYDTMSPDAVEANSCEDSPNGVPNSSIGWLGIDFDGTVFAIWNASYSDFEVTVRSAKTDEVLYRVYMPIRSFAGPSGSLGNVKGWLAATLVSSWGKHASFAFERLDDMFDELPNQYAKLKTAINRLAYPVDLKPDAREAYEAYLGRNAKRAVAVMAEDDEAEELRSLANYLVTKANRTKLVDACAEAPCMREYLLAYNDYEGREPQRAEVREAGASKAGPEQPSSAPSECGSGGAGRNDGNCVPKQLEQASHLDGMPLRLSWEFSLSGCRYSRRAAACKETQPGEHLTLVREPDNKHDPNAIRVEHQKSMLGYIPREWARNLAPALDAGARYVCEAVSNTSINTVGNAVSDMYVWLRVYAAVRFESLWDIDLRSCVLLEDTFNDRLWNDPERCLLACDNNLKGRHRKGDLIVSEDEKTVVGLAPGADPDVLVIPEGITEIGPLACRGTQARGIVLPDSLEVIYQGAFLGASGWLVRIPAGVRHIAPGAFCPSWKQGVDASWRPCYFKVDPANERFLALDGSLVEREGDGLRLLSLFFDDPMGEVLNWRNAFYRVPEGVTRLGRFSIAGQKNWCLRHLVLPCSLRYVESGFSHANSFESGNLPAGVVFEEGEEGFYEFARRFNPAPGKGPKTEGIAELEARYPWLVTQGMLPPEVGEERRQLAYFINKRAVCPVDSLEGEGQ